MKRYKVRILPSAYEDIRLARDWYRQHNADLPKRLNSEIKLSIEGIRANPCAFAIRYRNVRIANLKVFPYGLHYFIEENNGTIVIIAIHHTAMSPERWKARIKDNL